MRIRAVLSLLLLGACAAPDDAAPQNAAQAKLEAQADALETAAEAAGEPHALPPADAVAVRVACELGPRFLKEFDEGRRGLKAAEEQALRDQLGIATWRNLPKQAECGAGRTVTFQPEGFGAFVTAIAVAPGSRHVAIRGGWQMAPLAGGGGECLFERVGRTWQRRGCLQTWVS